MDRDTAAEWILSRVIDSSRAEELIGDQLEANPDASFLRFWMFVGWQVIAFTWRTSLGVICGGYVGVWSWLPIVLVSERLLHAPASPVMLWLTGLSMLLWCLSVFSVVRFGARSQMFWISISSAFLASFAATLLQQPYAKLTVLLTTAVFISFNVRTRKQRKVFATFIASVAIAWIMGFLVLRLQNALHPLSKWPLVVGAVLIPLMQGLVASHLYERSRKTRTWA